MATFCIVAGLSFAIPAFSAILFYEDFEDEIDTVVDPYRDWSIDGHGAGSIGLSTEQVKAGSKSYKFTVTGSSGDYVRKEISLKYHFNDGSFHFAFGGEYWVGFSIFLAEGYESPTGPGSWGPLHHQYHYTPDGPPTCDPQETAEIHLQIETGDEGGGIWKSVLGYDDNQCSTEESMHGVWFQHDTYANEIGKWTDFVLHIIWDYGDDDGLTQIWKDGVLIVNRSGGNCRNDALGPYMKCGIYGQLDDGQTMTVYYDEVRLGDENSSYSEVAPGGSVKLLPPTNVEAR
jgi:hypothetical protein